MTNDILEKIRNYLSSGGLFNPELMEHEKVRDMIMEARDKLEDNQWISVETRLPDDYKEVLIFSKRKQIFVARFAITLGWESLSSQEFIVTHWMPLPSPPKD